VEPLYGSSWLKWVTDLPVALDLLHRGELTLAEYVNTVRRSNVWCEWDQGDPFPLLLQALLVPYLWTKRGY
jgi:predicted ATP-grasp superfamily ATP-dependent carboligase